MAENAEKTHRLPPQLLAAVALAESGRWDADRQARIAWPWTVYAEGRGRYYDSKAEAIAEVEALAAKGVRNIDVGCMQVNLKYHPDAFDDLETAFDPSANADYAARFLHELYKSRRSWGMAVAHYHSTTREHAVPYRKRVFALWQDERRRAAEERRQANLARMAERRAQYLARQAERAARMEERRAALADAS
ncbi:transglycosylase SLT domain-containing protein [Oceanibacterium hippocampi]|nr:transglycosylase SLT domain-containing protein [Oceanibacterium hippocampi]